MSQINKGMLDDAVVKHSPRLVYVDVFRGLAILIMIGIQIFDFLSKKINIYQTPPYYVSEINSVTWFPPSLLFTFVTGMSLYLLLQKRKSRIVKNKSIAKEAAFKYGKYVLISLPFTWFMWDLRTYLRWEEAIQGIGLSAIFTMLFLLLIFKGKEIKITTKHYVIIISAIVFSALLQTFVRPYLISSGISSVFPFFFELGDISIFSLIGSVILNALFRGWFSIVNLFPMMLGGFLLVYLIKEKKHYGKIFAFSILFLAIAVLLHFTIDPINYYDRSFSLTFFAIGESALICSLVFVIFQKYKTSKKKIVTNIIGFFTILGLTAFFVYVGHYLLILKFLQVTQLNDLLSDLDAWLLTIMLVFVMYFVAKGYLRLRPKLPKILQL